VWVLALTLVSGHALGQPRAAGDKLVSKQGLTLYVFDNDVPGSGKSVCSPPCSNLHPPYLAEPKAAAAGDFGFVMRSDGARQWAYKRRPLYRWYADEKPGQTGGDGMSRNTWHVARP
jgi:predicted lipoprotein with Yx(FWY)xxD motif